MKAIALIKENQNLVIAGVFSAGFFLVASVLGNVISLVLFGAVVFVVCFVGVSLKNELYGLILMLILFLTIPYSSSDPSIRAVSTIYSLYSRFGTLLSPWDYLVFLLASIWVFKNWKNNTIKLKLIEYNEITVYLGLMVFAMLVGFLHVNGAFLSYGNTRMMQPIIGFIPFYYFLVMYLFTINFIKSRKDVDLMLGFLRAFGYIMLIYGAVKIFLIYLGITRTISGFGIPIVIYDQAILLIFSVLLYLSFVLLKVKTKHKNFLITLLLLIFVIASTRRFIYLVLFTGVLSTFYLAWKVEIVRSPRLLLNVFKILGLFFVFMLIVFLSNPDLVTSIYTSIKSINFVSKTGMSFGGDTRIGELKNIFLNMNDRLYTYIFGFGIGTNWKTIIDVPFDLFAFTKGDIIQYSSWYSRFHLPYLTKIYRFGAVGIMGFVIVFVYFLKRCLVFLKGLEHAPFYQAYALAISAFLLVNIFESGDSGNPTMFIFTGVLYGILTSMYRFRKEL